METFIKKQESNPATPSPALPNSSSDSSSTSTSTSTSTTSADVSSSNNSSIPSSTGPDELQKAILFLFIMIIICVYFINNMYRRK